MKLNWLRFFLVLGALFYFVGAIVHFFGLTLFPFYVSSLYTPYHDSVIALIGIFFFLLLLTIARDPIQNRDTLKVVIAGFFMASLFSILIIYKVDFAALGAPLKKTETLFEGGVGFVYSFILLWLYPRNTPLSK